MSDQTQTATPKRGGFTPEMRAKAAATRAANKAKREASAAKPVVAKAAATPKTAEFDGLTVANCCDNCAPTRCVISGIGVCMHPHKGGLHAPQMRDTKTLARYNRAKAFLKS